MKKFLAYYFIYRTTKNPMVAAQIYQILYGNHNPVNLTPTIVGTTATVHNTSKKQELEESLKYLKEKTIKTKKDKESINVLEAVIKNM